MTESTTPEAIGFGYAEIAYILKSMSTPGAEMSATVLRLREEMNSPVLPAAGASSLLGRGFATVANDEIEIANEAIPVAYALGKADLWTEISLIQGMDSDTVVHIESDVVSLLLQPRTLLTWFAFAQDPKITGPEAELDIIQEHVRQNPQGTAMIRARIEGADLILLVRPNGDDWAVGRIIEGEEDVVEQTGLSSAELGEIIADLRRKLRGHK